MTVPTPGPDTTDREIVVSRLIHAPPNLAFEAFTQVRHLSQWWGPHGFTTTTTSFAFRPGGVWEYVMHGPDGADYPNHVEWLEIIPPERIVLRHGSEADDPDAFVSTITLSEREDRHTLVTLRSLFNTRQQRDHVIEQYGAIEGAEQTLARLDGYVARMPLDVPEAGR